MQTILTYLGGYGIPMLISAATVAAAVLVALLGNFHPSVSNHVFRIGRKPARVEVPQVHGRIVVSVRSMDRDHVWMRVVAPADAARLAEGEQVRPMHDAHSSKASES